MHAFAFASAFTLPRHPPRTSNVSGSPGAIRHLPKRALLVQNHPRGQEVCCRCGSVWLTFDGQPQDIVLQAGQALSCTDDARLIVQALQDATVEIRRRAHP